ncbi:LacI family DNA-binding transcriptional regulator [Rugosimonospora acidiphila]|uniref:LacI family DNA-binding transcriptional regulator n=1 Tax=Rugosimonospora acidiphila TaxID=556531 RepID=A0ABP9SEC1_9ACTN
MGIDDPENISESARRTTLAAVAAAAGVSMPTVSKVVNGRLDVSAATRARVEEAIRDLRYVPVSGRGRGEERFVEIVFDDLLNPYAAEIVNGAADAGATGGVTVIPKRHTGDTPREWARRVSASGRDGIIIVTSVLTSEQIARFHEAGLPMVVIDTINLPSTKFTSIGSTNFTGGVAATEHLLGLGHRRIGHISGLPTLACSVARLHGYRAALERAAIPTGPVATGSFSYDTGVREALPWLDGPDRPTAIFAGSDQIAFGVLEAARLTGLRVPQDLSVVGFDDTYAAASTAPPLTTVHQPLREMGELAVQTLLRLRAGEAIASHHVELATRLEIRASTAPPPP